MRPKHPVSMIIGILLIFFSIFLFAAGGNTAGFVPALIGLSLVYLGFKGGKIPMLVFGHSCVVVGAYLVTWGIYLLPVSDPKFSHILGRPLFWGLFSIFGGICAIYHGFCNCIRRK